MTASAPTNVVLYIDTNAFIHVRDLKDVPWLELFPGAKHIQLYVAHTVIEELDRRKVDSNGRKRDRARAALRLIESAAGSETHSIELRAASPSIHLHIAPSPARDWAKFPQLDPTRPDDRLVMETLCHDGEAHLFSYDAGPIIRARLSGVKAFKPLDDWLLPDQATDEQQKIAALQRDLERAKSTAPKINFQFGGEPGQEELKFRIPRLDPLEKHLAIKLAEAALTKRPPDDIQVSTGAFGLAAARLMGGLTQYDADDYLARFSQFEGSVKRFFFHLHESVRKAAYVLHIPYIIENDSGVAAQGLRIEVELRAQHGFLIQNERSTARVIGLRLLELPKPPAPPEPYQAFPYLPGALGAPPDPRDSTKFYWFKRPDFSMTNSRQCEDFRARRTQGGEVCVWIAEEGTGPFSGELHVRVDASNMSAPVEVKAAFTLSEGDADWKDNDVLAMLPEEVRSALLATKK